MHDRMCMCLPTVENSHYLQYNVSPHQQGCARAVFCSCRQLPGALFGCSRMRGRRLTAASEMQHFETEAALHHLPNQQEVHTSISLERRQPSQSRSTQRNQYSRLRSLLLSSSLRMNHTKSSYPILPGTWLAKGRAACSYHMAH